MHIDGEPQTPPSPKQPMQGGCAQPMLNKNMFLTPRNPLEGAPIEGISPDGAQNVLAIPVGTSIACPGCKAQLPALDAQRNLWVCPECACHMRMDAHERIAMLADPGTFAEHDADLVTHNPIDFPEYEDKLLKARKATGRNDGVVTGVCTMCGEPCALFVMDAKFMMASMGTVVGEKISRLFEYASGSALPVVGVVASGGARMQEGIFSLMQMAKVSGAVGRHSAAGLFYAALLTDPTTGGVTASFAMQADIQIAEPGALIGFAGPRVIEQTIREKLPEGFQRAEYLLDHGMLDRVTHRKNLRDELITILRMLTNQPPAVKGDLPPPGEPAALPQAEAN